MDAQNFTADFGTAIKWLKEGRKVARKGWNGKNMWLVFMPPFRVEEPNERTQAHGIKEAFYDSMIDDPGDDLFPDFDDEELDNDDWE